MKLKETKLFEKLIDPGYADMLQPPFLYDGDIQNTRREGKSHAGSNRMIAERGAAVRRERPGRGDGGRGRPPEST